jgi:hypothetical protein
MNRWKGIITFLALTCILLCGVFGIGYLLDAQRSSAFPPRPTLARNEVMKRFRSRATPEELRQFDQLASADDASSQSRATEMVLFKLTSDELSAIGVRQTDDGDDLDWSIAFSSSSWDAQIAIQGALNRVGIGAWGSGGHGVCLWFVGRDKFFAAREVLLADPEVKRLGVEVVTPEFSLR